METGLKLIFVALGMLLIGVALPFMMVLELLESTLFLSFLSHGCSTLGLVLGFVGMAQYMAKRRR